MKDYIKNIWLTIVFLFWMNLLNIVTTFKGLFSAIFYRKSYYLWVANAYCKIGLECTKILLKAAYNEESPTESNNNLKD